MQLLTPLTHSSPRTDAARTTPAVATLAAPPHAASYSQSTAQSLTQPQPLHAAIPSLPPELDQLNADAETLTLQRWRCNADAATLTLKR